MDLYEDTNPLKYKPKSYTDEGITINETIYSSSIIVGLEEINPNWEPNSLTDLKDQHLEEILSFRPDIVLLGTGQRFIIPKEPQLALLHQHKIGVEYMDTGAACRTYLVLASEGRNVVAALLLK